MSNHEILKIDEEIPLDSIVRAYRRQSTLQMVRSADESSSVQDRGLLDILPETNLLDVIKDIADEIVRTTEENSQRAQNNARWYRIWHRVLFLLAIVLGFACSGLSINGLNEFANGQDVEQITNLVTGILIVVVPLLLGTDEAFDFKRRAHKSKKYHNTFRGKIKEVQRILVSEAEPVEMLSKLSDIEIELNDIRLKVYDNELRSHPDDTQAFQTCTSRHCRYGSMSQRQNAMVNIHVDDLDVDSDSE